MKKSQVVGRHCVPGKTMTGLLLAFVLVFGALNPLFAQVASPHNFPHAYGFVNTGQYGPQTMRSYHAMGMNGQVVFSPIATFNFDHYVLNRQMDQYMTWGSNISGPNVIQKNSRIWLSNSSDSRVCTVDTMGVVLNQLKITNSNLVQMVADTNDHVYLVYKSNLTTGFGVVRFGASFVPDWHNFYPGADPTEAFWGIDQRLYVTCFGRVSVLDANGNRLKDLYNVGTNYTVYQDHGLGIVSMVADTVKVIRTDSTMAVRWAKKFRPTPGLWGLPYTVIEAAGVAAPGSNDLVVTATARVTLQSTMNCNYPYTEEIYLIVLDNNGVVQGQEVYPGSGSNKFQSTVTGTPFGDPMFAFDNHSCLTAANIDYRYLAVVPGYDVRQSCSGTPPAVSSQNFTLGTFPIVGALGTTVAPSLSLSTDNLAFGVSRFIGILNNGGYGCIKPCLSVTTTPQGGGQVAFNDNTFGFYTIAYDFGDGTTGSSPDPVHAYPPYGTWPVTVIATNGCGSDTVTIPVHSCSTAVVSGPANICVNSANTYTETSGLNPTGLSWLVNGVSVGTGSSFTWTPTVAGTYTLGTVYFDAPCRDTTWRTVLVSPAMPVAGFTYAVTAPGQLTFTNTSTLAQSYSWAFGDGTTSTATSPVKTYFAPYVNGGNFNICLTATNACGSNTYCYNFTCPIPYSNFSITSTAGLTATISNAAVNGTISWDFGDGTTATGPQSSHTYALPGTYVICQTVTNACATHSSCQTVMVANSSTASHRTFFANGFDYHAHAIAAQPNGDVLVATATMNPNACLMAFDSSGAIRSPMTTWSGGATQIFDLHAMTNGHFAFIGHSFNSGSNFDPFWGELDKFGNIVQAKYLPINTIGQLGSTSFKVPSGYFFVVKEGQGQFNSYYIKLDLNFNVQYVRYQNTSKIYGGMEAPDGSMWLVQQPNANSTTLEFVHLNPAGIGYEKYTTNIPFGGTNALFLGTMGLGMDCDGNMYGMMAVSDVYASTGATPRLGVFRFNTMTHAVESRLYRVGMTGSANNPLQNPVIRSLVKYPNGHWIGWGYLNRIPSQFNVAPGTEKFVVDLDPSNFTSTFSAYGTTGAAYNEDIWDAYVAGSGQCYTLGKSGIMAKPLEIHRHSSPTDCQLPASVYAPQALLEFTNTTATYSSATISTTGLTTAAVNWTRVSAPANGTSLLQCSGSCPSGLTASFTYAVVGNTVTFTSTGTPGAMLNWSILGQNCLANGGSGNSGPTTFTYTLPCGSHTVTLTASDQCGTTSSTQTLLIGNAQPLSIGPNQSICPGGSATFTATPGFISYLWSNGATTNSVTVSAGGTYSVTATDAGGCMSTAQAILTQNPTPTVSIGPNQTICSGATATFATTPLFASYLWSNGATTSSVSVGVSGTVSVTVTDANGCTGTASASLTLNPAPTVSVSSSPTVCPGTNVTFNATPGFATYLWSNGASTNSVSVSASGTYSVTVTDANGCTATAASSLTNFPSPNFSLGTDTSFCADTTWALNGPLGATVYVWSTGATTGSLSVGASGTYHLTVIDVNGCMASDTIQLQLSPDCVWPGDADHDGVANNTDLLAVAYGMAATGTTRPNATLSWYGQPATNWTNSLPLGANFKHSDCDGNSIVQFADTIAIHQNFGLTHNKNNDILTGVPVWIEPELDSFPVGDTVFFLVHWGEPGTPVTFGHGLAFTLHIDPANVTPGTLYGRFPNSFLGNGVPDLATLTVPFAGSGDVFVAVSRHDGVGRNGHGAVMRMGFLPDQVNPLTATLGYVPVRISSVVAVDGDFAAITSAGLDDSILVYNPVNAVTASQPLLGCTLYPIPAADVAYLDVQFGQDAAVALTLTDMQGRVLTTVQPLTEMKAGRHRISIPTNGISEGVYFLRLQVNETVKVMKLVVAR